MRNISFNEIESAVYSAISKCATVLNDFTINKIKCAMNNESDNLSKSILSDIYQNALLAKEENIPMCQDTGIVVVFANVGRDLHLDCDLYEAINSGVRKSYNDFYLRKSVADPLTRINTKDNTPAIVHTKIVEGDKLTLKIALKGAGSENMSRLKMMNPTDSIEDIISFVKETLVIAGGKPCPPLFIGLGIGGNFETCALLAKEAIYEETHDTKYKDLEERIVNELNTLNIGPMGLKGKTSCFDVFIKTKPCHIASLPVACNIQCHANRHIEVII